MKDKNTELGRSRYKNEIFCRANSVPFNAKIIPKGRKKQTGNFLKNKKAGVKPWGLLLLFLRMQNDHLPPILIETKIEMNKLSFF